MRSKRLKAAARQGSRSGRKTVSIIGTPYALMLDDIKRSGLLPEHAHQHKLEALSREATNELTGAKHAFASYKIPYFNLDGTASDFFRLRFVGTGAFGAQIKQRYWQPFNTLPHLYLPPGRDWATVAKDTSVTLIITEGEKKAAKACLSGLICVGVGGVWNWKSKKARIPLIPDLEDFDWNGRSVELVFDSDVSERVDLLAALGQLAVELGERGALVARVDLPKLNGAKTGLDDYLLIGDARTFSALPRQLFDAGLYALNAEYAYLRFPSGYIVRLADGEVQSVDHFKTETANRILTRIDRAGYPKKLHAGMEWIRWSQRREVTKLVYRPRRWDEEIQLGDGSYNLWPGWGAVPATGDVTPWMELLAHVIPDQRERQIFESWLAYPLQHPGTKLSWAVLIWSNEQGVGKSLIGELVSQIYGVSVNAVELKTAEELLGTFNSWANRRQFITVVETHAPDSRAQLNKLKALITADQSRVNEKFKPEYSIDDRINYLFNSQYEDALPLEKRDRRFMIIHAREEKLPPALAERVSRWKRGEQSTPALFHYLLNLKIDREVRPHGEAPTTSAKLEMQRTAQRPLEQYCERIMETPRSNELKWGWPYATRDLWTASEIALNYNATVAPRWQVSDSRMGAALRWAGAVSVGPRVSDSAPVGKVRFQATVPSASSLFAIKRGGATPPRRSSRSDISKSARRHSRSLRRNGK